jgi:hypothetical protein
MLPSVAVIPPDFFGPDLAALLGTVAWLAIVPVIVALGILVLGIATEDAALAAARRTPKPVPPRHPHRATSPSRSAA